MSTKKTIRLTEKQKTDYSRTALGLAGIGINNATAEVIWRTIEGLQKKGGQFSLHDSVDIEFMVKRKYEKKDKPAEPTSTNKLLKLKALITEKLAQKNQREQFGALLDLKKIIEE